MNKMLEKLMAAKKASKPMSSEHMDAKRMALQELKKAMGDVGAEKLSGLKKVTVAAPDTESLKAGLDKAKQLTSEMPDMAEETEMEETPEEETSEKDSLISDIEELGPEDLQKIEALIQACKKKKAMGI